MNLLVLATESGGASGQSPGMTLAVWILLIALAAFAVAYVVVGPGRRRGGPKRLGDIPLAMRPYHSDEELETTGLERAMSWGVALAAFAALFLPLYWIIEPARIEDKRDEFYEEDVAAGRALYAEACVQCHGENAQGGFAPHPDPNIDAPWPAPQLNNIYARYEDSEIVDDVEALMTEAIKQGRAGTPMPAWGAAYEGPYNDQQVEEIVRYLQSIQTGELTEAQAEAQALGASGEELYQQNCARCHGQEAEGRVGPNLINIFERYGAGEGAGEDAREEVRKHIRYTLNVGRNVPTQANMPSFAGVLSDEQMTAIIEYLEGIQVTGGPRYGQLGGDPTVPSGDGAPDPDPDDETQDPSAGDPDTALDDQATETAGSDQ